MRERNWLCGLRFITEKAAQLLDVYKRQVHESIRRGLRRLEKILEENF